MPEQSSSTPMPEDKWGAHPQTIDELVKFIESKTGGQHDYNTSAEALHDIAVAAFNYAAGALGNSGFQAGYAALKFVGTVNGIDGPYGLLKAENMLYPQYEPVTVKAAKMAEEWKPWLAEQAREKLAEHPEVTYRTVTDDDGKNPVEMPNVHPNVHRHWQRLAAEA